MKTTTSTVYIDESGDLGANTGTRWFVLSAVIVDKADERHIRDVLDSVKSKLNLKTIHMRNISDFNRRAYITTKLNEVPFVYVNVIMDTDKYDKHLIPSANIAYNYLCKILLERVSYCLYSNRKTADIILSARGTNKDKELIDYIREKLLPYNKNYIDQELYGKVAAKPFSSWDLLQLADVCATTMFWAYEVNGYGFRCPCFAYPLKTHLYKGTEGIKFFIKDMKPDKKMLDEQLICKKRTPGATAT